MIYTYKYVSPLGDITLSEENGRLTGLWFEGQAHFGTALIGDVKEISSGEAAAHPALLSAVTWLDEYFSGKVPDFTPPLSVEDIATPFQKKVWDFLLTIPYGKTVTYGEIAGEIHSSPRAVGNAVGRNPISVIIPCHRVMGAGGSLTGYAGGIERKRQLLDIEKITYKI